MFILHVVKWKSKIDNYGSTCSLWDTRPIVSVGQFAPYRSRWSCLQTVTGYTDWIHCQYDNGICCPWAAVIWRCCRINIDNGSEHTLTSASATNGTLSALFVILLTETDSARASACVNRIVDDHHRIIIHSCSLWLILHTMSGDNWTYWSWEIEANSGLQRSSMDLEACIPL